MFGNVFTISCGSEMLFQLETELEAISEYCCETLTSLNPERCSVPINCWHLLYLRRYSSLL